MNATIRLAIPNDLAVVQDLNHKLFLSDVRHDPTLSTNWPYEEGATYFRQLINGEIGVCFVAEVEGVVIGYLAGCIRKPHTVWQVRRSEVENMFVDETYRSHGIGARLMQVFFDWSRGNGVTHVLVGAFSQNDRAIAFYEKSGFQPYETMLQAKLDD